MNFIKLPKKTELPEKFKLLAKRGFNLMETRKNDSCPLANPHSKSEHDVYGTEYLQQQHTAVLQTPY